MRPEAGDVRVAVIDGALPVASESVAPGEELEPEIDEEKAVEEANSVDKGLFNVQDPESSTLIRS